MKTVVKCPKCGHSAEDHKKMTYGTTKYSKGNKVHHAVENRDPKVCSLSKSFLKRTLIGKKEV